ncbi:MAG TPA: YdcF family protein [Crocinitomix sp.]|nr:YdcF family protein [Crocinitomix sp.]
MFFILSKILSYFINPFNWILFFFIFSFVTKNVNRKKRFFKIGIVLLLFFTNNVIFLEFTRLWEDKGTPIKEVGKYDVAVVLGGMAEYNTDLERISIRRGGDRIWQAIHLYHLGKVDKILISGDSGFLVDKGLREAEQFKQILIDECIPENDIIVESKSKNTYQNAIETKKILDQTPKQEKVLLVTSALHMKRSKACFEKVGFKNFGVFSTDHYTGKNRGYYFDQYFIPNESVLNDWNKLIHEWIGYLTYWLVGYI